jgi:hypothetical protein
MLNGTKDEPHSIGAQREARKEARKNSHVTLNVDHKKELAMQRSTFRALVA